MSRQRRYRLACVIVGAGLLARCGESAPGTTPQPTPTPAQDGWYAYVVQCTNCPGLTNAELDRTVLPHRARLHVGQQTSLRAAVRDGCEAPQATLPIARWIASDPQAIRVEPSSTESAIVTALAPGLSSVTVERQLANGGLGQKGLKDALSTAGCGPLPDVVFEIVP